VEAVNAAPLLDIEAVVRDRRRHWLVTGAAGFIGSHLLEALLRNGQQVTTIDNLSTGRLSNFDHVRASVGEQAWGRHRFVQADIADPDSCKAVCEGVELVLHQAALGSVPRSLIDPLATHRSNATGFLNMLTAARESGAVRFVYAASSSTYGDSPKLPKVEEEIGRPLSPYAVTKYLNELYADVFARCYGFPSIGLRYFNVFGARQDPQGAYAAVIPRWLAQMQKGVPCVINGEGETSRDFCYVANAVQANLRAALTTDANAVNQIYNVAVGQRTTLTELHTRLASGLQELDRKLVVAPPEHRAYREGDIRHSLADIGKARALLHYEPTHTVAQGLAEALRWYLANPS
jgi:UDP-N-acetylglucosamine 4-epimerase